MLFLYCHVTEIDDLYNIAANLLRVCSGRRYIDDPFSGDWHESEKPALYPHSKIHRIEMWSEEVGLPNVGILFREMFVRQVRNAFFHSDYIIHANNFNIKKGQGVTRDNIESKTVDVEWLHCKMQLAINTALCVVSLVTDHRHSYRNEKVIPSRLGGEEQPSIDIALIIEEGYGLVGFRPA